MNKTLSLKDKKINTVIEKRVSKWQDNLEKVKWMRQWDLEQSINKTIGYKENLKVNKIIRKRESQDSMNMMNYRENKMNETLRYGKANK